MNSATKQPKRLLVISLDGLDARYLQRLDQYGLRLPTLRRLMAGGAFSLSVSTVYPSVTYPVHTTIATGALPQHHGIFGNDLFEPPGTKQTGEWHWFARDIRAETLWDAAARNHLKTCLVSWPVGGGAGDYNLPEIVKPNAPLTETLALIKRTARPQGIVEELERHDPQLYRFSNKDEHDDLRTRFAEYVITEKRPDVVLVHLFDFDHFQHDYGPFTPEAFAILEKEDGYITRLLAAAERAGTLAETASFIVSDHGFKPIKRLVHPGVMLAQAGLLRFDKAGEQAGAKVISWRAFPYVTSASCAIILHDANDSEALNKLRSVFKPLAGREGSGILRVLEADEVRALGANPQAALMLEAADGYSFGNNLTGEAITPAVQKGQHGYLPTRPGYSTFFIATGPGIERKGDLGHLSIIDVGPTIARLLNLKLRDADGHALQLR